MGVSQVRGNADMYWDYRGDGRGNGNYYLGISMSGFPTLGVPITIIAFWLGSPRKFLFFELARKGFFHSRQVLNIGSM